MKHIILSLTLLTVVTLTSDAQSNNGNTPATLSPVNTLKSGTTAIDFKSSDINLAKNDLSFSGTPNKKGPNVTAPEKPGENDFTTNRFKVFLGYGNTNIVSDIVTLTDKSFVGELGWQIRGGVRLFENYELDFGVYGREMPDAAKHPELNYNKFLGYSGAFMYEFQIPDVNRWGVPFGFEVLKYKKNIDITSEEGKTRYDHYSALAYGPKIGLRYHVSKLFFIEAELEAQYEHFKSNVDWDEKSSMVSNNLGSFKFFGFSVNRCF